ncbi:CLOCK-interacting pacemaker-like [Heptranchias perlo]|uniref:CLOCK-interacting pacemaker-like n=1 Tax=Heptranchias perlo TaxID=212740 RepID=UPI0035598C67
MSLDKVPMAESSRPPRKNVKERMSGISVKLENPPDSQYGQAEKRNPMGSVGNNQPPSLGESEKDSGFSDTNSEYLSTLEQTDSEDQSTHKRPAALNRAEESTAAQSSLPSLTPVYIVKNVVLKEPLSVPTRSQLVHAQLQTWGSQHALPAPPGQTRVVLIRQPSAASLKPREMKTGAAKDTYLPILNSYPRIAPHPDKNRDDSGSQWHRVAQDVRTADHGKSKRLCVDETGEPSLETSPSKSDQTPLVAPVANCQSHQEAENSRQLPCFGAKNFSSQFDVSVSPSPALSPNLVSASESSESLCSWSSSSSCSSPFSSSSSSSIFSLASSRTPSAQSPAGSGDGRPAARASKRPISNPGKQRRFRNTVEILSRSGLLEITLRTKDLMRQNSSTQRQIDELKEHARLFCSAMRSSDPRALLKLQEAMKCSGGYGPTGSAASCPPAGSGSSSGSSSVADSPANRAFQATLARASLP